MDKANCPRCGLSVFVINNQILCGICGLISIFEVTRERIVLLKNKLKRRTEIGTKYCNFWSITAFLINILQIIFLCFFYGTLHNAPEEITAILLFTLIGILMIGILHINMVIKKYHPDLCD